MMIMENIYHDYSYSISQYLGKMVGSTGHPFSSIIGNVDLESLAIATQFLNKFNNEYFFRILQNKVFPPFFIFTPGKDAIRGLLWDFDAEGKSVPDSHCFHLLLKNLTIVNNVNNV